MPSLSSFISKQKTGEVEMEVTFVRHGPSCCESHGRCSAEQFTAWIKSYDDTGIFQEPVVPLDTVRKCQEASLIVTSPLLRAVESAHILLSGIEKQIVKSTMFREAELPASHRIPSFIRMKPRSWAMLFRLLWVSGYGGGTETFRQAGRRAEKARDTLVEYARIHGKVVVIGHGFFNMMVAKELMKKGWKGEYPPSRHHFCCTTYVQPKEHHAPLLNGNGQ
jgi:broad specificity phosphatase PhoE